MLKYLNLIVALTLLVGMANAQNDGQWSGQGGGGKGRPGGPGGPSGPSVMGKVMDESKEPVPYASVALYNQSDSSLAAGAASNEMGRFRVEAKPGKYYLIISFLSLSDKVVSDIEVKNEPVHLGPLTMVAGSTTLEEFAVEAEKSQMELKLDKRVFNVGKDVSNLGGNATDVLDNIPSVTVDVEGNVSLRGSENVRILIDGKPSGMVGISTTDALRQLDSDMIERIEVITNPSARYDAEGEAGIINIVLKKEKRKGINGSVSLRAGYPANYGGSFNLNFRKKKVNFFASAGIGYRESPGSGYNNQTWTLADTSYRFDSERRHNRGGLRQNVRVGTDFMFNKYNTLTVSAFMSRMDGDNDAQVLYRDYDINDLLTQLLIRDEIESEINDNQELTLSYRKTFEQKGREWTTDFKYINNDELEQGNITQTSDVEGIQPLYQRTRNTENEERWLFQSDYVHPFAEEGKWEIGVRSNMRIIDNDYIVEEQNSDASWFTIPGFDDRLIYTENIHAGYLMAGNEFGKFSVQGGLRAEYSDIKTELVDTKQINARDYLSFFPSAHISYELKQENSFQVSYSRRIKRPRFWYLLPFFNFSDSRNIFSGNPNLDPEFTDSYEVGHLKYWKKGSLLSSVYYRHTTGVIERILVSDSAGTTSRFPINLGMRDSYGIEFSGSMEITDWWNFNGSFNFFKAITKGDYEGQNFDAETWAWNARFVTKWKIKKKFNLQTSLMYRSPRITAQGETLPMYGWDAGLSLDCLKGKGTLTFSARDILNRRRRGSIVVTDEFRSESAFQWRARTFLLNFNYRINQKKRRGGRGGGDFGGDMDGGM